MNTTSQYKMTMPKMAIIGVFIILLLVLLYFSMQKPAPSQAPPVVTPAPNPGSPAQAPTVTTPAQTIPPLTLPPSNKVCQRGFYCDGTPVPDSEATEGTIVCGGNNIRYQCVNNGGTLGWKALDSCTPNMAHYCNQPPTTCLNGWFCDGTVVDKVNAAVGSIVCGSGNQQYQCISNGAGLTPSWKLTGATCTPGMAHMCK